MESPVYSSPAIYKDYIYLVSSEGILKAIDMETGKEEYMPVYENVISFVTMRNQDEKNFAAGVEDNTFLNIQIPKRDIEGNLYVVNNEDRVILSNLKGDLSREIKVESMNEFGEKQINDLKEKSKTI
mgnify:CR=1 FL=1